MRKEKEKRREEEKDFANVLKSCEISGNVWSVVVG